MVAVLLSLGAAAAVGSGDFFAGLLSRRLPAVLVLLSMELAGAVPAAVVLLATNDGLPTLHQALSGALAGLSGCAGLVLFYRALAQGTMSIVAPVSSVGIAIPVVLGVATGDRPGVLQAVGLFVAFAGVMVAAREPSDDAEVRRASRTVIVLSLLSAIGFGIYFAGADVIADAGVGWTMLLPRAAAIPVIALAGRATGALRPLPRRDVLYLVGIGLLDVSGAGLLALANTRGLVSITSVIVALYPLATMALARALLAERIDRVRGLGVAGALAGVALIAAG